MAVGDAAPDDRGKFVAFESGGVSISGTAKDGIHVVFQGTTDAGVMGLFRASRPAVGSSSRQLEEVEMSHGSLCCATSAIR